MSICMCTKIEWVGPCGMTDELSRKLVQTNGPNAPGQIHCCRFKTNLLLGFQAYKELLRKTGSREPTLPGLPYSPEQLFFISNAQVLTCKNSKYGTWCISHAHRCGAKSQLWGQRASYWLLMCTVQLQYGKVVHVSREAYVRPCMLFWCCGPYLLLLFFCFVFLVSCCFVHQCG